MTDSDTERNWETYKPFRIGSEADNTHIECPPEDACDLREWA